MRARQRHIERQMKGSKTRGREKEREKKRERWKEGDGSSEQLVAIDSAGLFLLLSMMQT